MLFLSAVLITSCAEKDKNSNNQQHVKNSSSQGSSVSSAEEDSNKVDSSTSSSEKNDDTQKDNEKTNSTGKDNNDSNSGSSLNKDNDNAVSPKREEVISNSSSGGGNNENNVHLNYPAVVTDKSLTKYWNIIDAVAEAGQVYYNDNFSKTRLIANNGYLYNWASKEKIDVNYLIKNGYLSSKYANSGCEVLLLNCDDFNNYDTVSLKDSECGLTVFVSLKNPNDNSYLIATSKSMGGSLSASQYAALLNSYYQDHGPVSRLYPDTDTYNRILNFISMYEAKYEDYYVRSVYLDDKYAFVTLSPASNTADIREYILKKSNSIWEVAYSSLEKEPRMLVAVNKKLPDFNISMLPACSTYDYRNSIDTSNSEVLSKLMSEKIIKSENYVKYICSTSKYAYVNLKNELKFLCIKENGEWSIIQVASCDDAERKMLSKSRTAPVFIILDK
jgi:hypothetical protein